MYDISIRRIQFTTDADVTLKMMKARTGLLPNILCRIAFCLSLDEVGKPKLVTKEERSTREINRYTLLGEYDAAYIALLKVRLAADKVNAVEANEYFVAHIHRGIALLAGRVKSVADLRLLMAA